MSDLGTARGRIEIDASGAEEGFRRAQDSADTTFGSLEASSGAMIKTGTVIAGMGAAITGGLGLAVHSAAGFEESMNRVGAITGETGESFDQLSDLAKELGSSTAFSASEVAEGMGFLAMAGFETNEILEALPGTLDLAAAGNLELGRAADIASNVLTGYGLEAEEISRVNDVLASAASNANTDINQLGDAMGHVAPVANASGLAFEETTAAIGALSDAGIQGGRAGTTLRQIIASIENQTPGATAALEDMGVKTHNSAGEMLPLVDIVSQMEEAGLSTAQAMEIFGSRAGPGMAALVDQGSESLQALTGELEDSGGTASEMADRQLEGLNGAITQLQSAIEGALIGIGEQLLPTVTRLAEGLTVLVQRFASIPGPVQKVIAIVGVAAGGFLLFAGTSLIVLGTVIKFIAVVKQLGPVFTLLVKGIRMAIVAFRALTMAMLTNPFVLIAVAVIALAYLIYRYWDEIAEFISNAWETITNAAGAAVNWIKGIWQGFRDWLGGIWNGITEGAANAWAALRDTVTNAVEGVLDWLGENWQAVLLTVLLGPFGLLIEYVRRNWDEIREVFQAGVEAVVEFFVTLPERIGYFIGSAVHGAIFIFWSLPQAIGEVINNFLERVREWAANLLARGVEAGSNFISALVEWFQELPSRVGQWLTRTIARTVAWAIDMVIQAQEMGQNVLAAIVEFFSQLPSRVHSFLIEAFARTVAWVVDMVAKAREMGRNVLEAIVEFFSQLPGRAARFFAEVVSSIAGAIREAASTARDFARGIYDAIRDILRELPSLVMDMIGNAISAIGDMAKRAFNAAKDVAGDLWDGFKRGLGISSPSFIEEAMFQIVNTMDQETKKLSGQVRDVHRTAADLPDLASDASVRAMLDTGSLGGSLRSLVGINGMPIGGNEGADIAERSGSIEVNVYNPEPEPASTSVTRELRKRSALRGVG